jgi:sugar/nucleoside kinase (ribokinase family)
MSRIIVLGDLNLDVHARQPAALAPGEEVRDVVRAEAGGSAGTFARVAAAHGASVSFLGCVGDDLIGDLLIRSLEADGVDAHVQRDDRPSGVILALEQGEERSMVCSRGANDGIQADRIGESLFDDADHLHVSGYAFLSDAQGAAVDRALALARAAGIPISIDPPPANLIRVYGSEAFLDRLPDGAWLFPNRTEGELLAGAASPKAIVDGLANRFAVGALTLGPDGAFAWVGPVRYAATIKPVAAADTTGAGDAFAGAFVAAYHERSDIVFAIEVACAAARAHLATRHSSS